MLRAGGKAYLWGCLLLLLCSCSYSWKQAIQDAEKPQVEKREKALNYLVEYMTQSTGKYGEYQRRKRSLVAIGKTKLPKSINTLRVILMHEGDARLRITAIKALAGLRSKQAFEEIQNALKDRELPVRMAAAAALGELGDERALGSLLKSLEDPKPQVREASVKALTQLKANVAIPYLVNALDDKETSVRLASQEALLTFGDVTVEPLIREMCNLLSTKRLRVSAFLPKYGTKIYPQMLNAFKVFPGCRDLSVLVLGKISGDRYTWPLLKKLLDKPSPEKAKEHVAQLSRVGTFSTIRAILALWYEIPVEQRIAMRLVLGKSSAKVGEPAIKVLVDASFKGRDMAIRSTAVLALGYTGAKAVPYLDQYLRSSYQILKYSAIMALGRIGKPALPKLLRLIDSPDEELRIRVLKVTAPIRDKRVVDKLIPQLKDESAKIRVEILKALALQGDRRAIEPIRALLKDPINNVIMKAIQTLLRLGDTGNMELYVVALKQGPYPPEPGFVKTLGRFGATQSIPIMKSVLKRYLADWRLYVRKAKRLYRSRFRGERKAVGSVTPERQKALEVEVKKTLKEQPARQEMAMCSFTEAMRALMRQKVRISPILRKSRYRHQEPFNPLLNLPKKCPWPSLGGG